MSRDDIKSNWSEFPSRPDMVYLSTTYPFTFSCCTSDKIEKKGVVFEVDLMSLDQDLLYPDEDYIWQTTTETHGNVSYLNKLHKHIKKNIEDFHHYWAHSLSSFDGLGNCSYRGTIEPGAIERACIVDWPARDHLAREVLEPTISIRNHKIMGKHYRKMVKWFFGDVRELPQVARSKEHLEMFCGKEEEYQIPIDFWILQSKLRTGITVVNLDEI